MDAFTYTPPTEPWLDKLYQDKDLVVLNKPSGILSVPGRGAHLQDSLYWRLQQEYPGVQSVHRLDLGTSGVILFALRRKAERELKRQFRERLTKKRYLARVWGVPAQTEGAIELPLTLDHNAKPKQKVCFEQGRQALTHYRVLSTDAGGNSLLELHPVTGRSHQLRVHLMAIGHPILGDNFYAHPQARAAADRLLLHAESLGLYHPYSGEWIHFSAPASFAGSP